MSKIRKAIQFHQQIEGTDLDWIVLLESCLSPETQSWIEHGSLDLRILARLIRMTMDEHLPSDRIEDSLVSKLRDANLVLGLKKDFGI